MYIYSSQLTITAVPALTLLLFLPAATGGSPLRTLHAATRYLSANLRWLYLAVGIGSVFAINSFELALESAHADQITWDFTPAVARVGSGFLIWLQSLGSPPLTELLTFVYVVLFPVLGIASLAVYSARADWESLQRLILGLAINYVVALPFYLLVPVREAWHGGAGIEFLIPRAFPAFETLYRPLSGLDNCFPSLHTSLSLTFAWVAVRSGDRRLAALVTAGAGLVVFSTLYLGVHWVLDMASGVILSVLAGGLLPAPALSLPVQRIAQRLWRGLLRSVPASRER